MNAIIASCTNCKYGVLQPKQKENENENAVQMHAGLEEKLFWRETTSFQKKINMSRKCESVELNW